MFVHIYPQPNSHKVQIADLLMKFLDIMIITEYDFLLVSKNVTIYVAGTITSVYSSKHWQWIYAWRLKFLGSFQNSNELPIDTIYEVPCAL